jgi:hypothetical protein
MKRNALAFLLLLCLCLVAIPSHAAPVAVVDGWSWAELYTSVLEWLGLGEAVEKEAPAPPPPGDPNTTDGGGCIDPDGKPIRPCPIQP